MKLSQLMAGVPGSWPDTEIAGLTCDSRRVEPGWAFVCLRGTASDGHDFARKAEEKGAAVILAERDTGTAVQRLLPDTHAVWPLLCANWFGHPADGLHLIGFTGTNGKTTSTFLTKHILERVGHRVGLIGTIQNMVGDEVLPSDHTTPDAYELQELFRQMADRGCDCVVMEVSSHALAQGRTAGLTFDVGVFTNLTQDHLDYHKTMENYMQAKKRLFLQSRCAIVNRDDPWAEAMTQGITCPVYSFSLGDDRADYTARNVRQRPDGVDFELLATGAIGRVRLKTPGLFSVYNAMGSAACALALGVPFDTVTAALSETAGVKGRAEVVPTGRDFTVVIDYAHTPDGLENICKTMRECCHGRLIVVFGCGGDRDRGKRPKMGAVAAKYADVAVVTSDNPRSEEPEAIIAEILTGMDGMTGEKQVIPNRTEAIRWALSHAKAGDTVLLAGKGHETYQILKDRTIHLDEREVVADALSPKA